MRRRIVASSVAIAVAVAVAGFALSVVVAGEVVTQPARRSMGVPPSDPPAVSIEFRTPTNQLISGWMVHGKPGLGAVLLLHGVRADRRDMVGRARFLNRLGYSALLIDLPAHGESSGDRITYGLGEAEAVSSALAYLSRTLPADKIGVIGVSLGAASLVLSKPSPAPSAIVLESMFPTMREAVSNRLRSYVGPAADWIAPLLLWQLRLRFGISSERLRPISELPLLHSAVLIASGTIDRYTTLAETQRVYAAANEPKELWLVDGAAHVDLHAFDPKAYESRISTFLAKHLRNAG